MAFTALTSTFTPLKRGRFRCNQTGAILKKGQVAAYRVQRANSGRPRPEPAVKLPSVFGTFHPATGGFFSISSYTSYECPKCRYYHDKRGRIVGEKNCDRCRTRFIVKLG
jgi:hypothetical protein